MRQHDKTASGNGWLAAFLRSQRVAPGSAFSSFLSGESAMKTANGTRSKRNRNNIDKGKIEVVPGSSVHLDGYMMAGDTAALQPPMVLQSPLNFSRPLTLVKPYPSTPGYIHPAFASRCDMDDPRQSPLKTRQQNGALGTCRRRQVPSQTRLRNSRIKCKSVGTFVSGTVLAVVLTVYLAMATANAVPTTAFHVTFIFCIIVLTMVFAHFLIRLCMLTLRERPAFAKHQPIMKKRRRHQRHQVKDLESGLLRSASLINQIHKHEHLHSRSTTNTDKASIAAPPAYGWWRGSVRIDPEEIRYYDPDQSELHQRTRSLVFAGSGQRPPSYTSDPLEVRVNRPEPLFHRTVPDASACMAREI